MDICEQIEKINKVLDGIQKDTQIPVPVIVAMLAKVHGCEGLTVEDSVLKQQINDGLKSGGRDPAWLKNFYLCSKSLALKGSGNKI